MSMSLLIIVVADKPVCEKSSSVAVGVSRKRVSKVKSKTFWKLSFNSKCELVSQQSLSRKHVSKVRFCWDFLVTFPSNQKCNRQWRCGNSLKIYWIFVCFRWPAPTRRFRSRVLSDGCWTRLKIWQLSNRSLSELLRSLSLYYWWKQNNDITLIVAKTIMY